MIICRLDYIEKQIEAERRIKAGERQRYCGTCRLWQWDDECDHPGKLTQREFEMMAARAGEPMEALSDPYHDHKLYHKADKCNEQGGVSALCFTKPKTINLKLALWTTDDRKVTCPKCLKKLNA